jgi:hypothetical protein
MVPPIMALSDIEGVSNVASGQVPYDSYSGLGQGNSQKIDRKRGHLQLASYPSLCHIPTTAQCAEYMSPDLDKT